MRAAAGSAARAAGAGAGGFPGALSVTFTCGACAFPQTYTASALTDGVVTNDAGTVLFTGLLTQGVPGVPWDPLAPP